MQQKQSGFMFGKTSKVSWCLAFWVRVCVSRVEWESLLWEALECGTVLEWGCDEPPVVPK